MQAEISGHLATLRLVPAEFVLILATLTIEMASNGECFCGVLAEIGGNRTTIFSDDACRELFGGEKSQWAAVYAAIKDPKRSTLEEAFALRVAECVR